MKRLKYLLLAVCSAALAACEGPVVDDFGVRLPEEPLAITGCVTDVAGNPLADVVVSDGYTVVRTGADGRYEIMAPRCASFVWVSSPEGYMAPLKASGIPDFFRPLGSFETEQTCDFALEKLDGSKPWVMLAVGDPQVKTAEQVGYFREEGLADMNALMAADPSKNYFAVMLGDLVYDQMGLYDAYVKALSDCPIPKFHVIGNHDHDKAAVDIVDEPELQDPAADDDYESYIGPTYYSFDLAGMHFLMLDNVYMSKKGGTFEKKLTDNQIEWIKKDLALVPKTKKLVVCLHIATRQRMFTGLGEMTELYDLLEGYDVQIFSAHAHAGFSDRIRSNIYERTLAAMCGTFWSKNRANHDGTPCGYGVAAVDPSQAKHFTDYYYKALDRDRDYQMKVYSMNASRVASNLQVNIWDWDPATWTVKWFENGVDKGELPPVTTPIEDPDVYNYFLGDTNTAKVSDHMFLCKPQPHAKVRVEATNTLFGKTYTAEIADAGTPNQVVVPMGLFEEFEGKWQYAEDFNSLPAPSVATAAFPWTNGTTLKGWRMDCVLKSGSPMVYQSQDGSVAAGAFKNFGTVGNTNRALGALTSGSIREVLWGVLLKNNTGKKIKKIRISYYGEVWRSGSNIAFDKSKDSTDLHQLRFSYVKNPEIFADPFSFTEAAMPSTVDLSQGPNRIGYLSYPRTANDETTPVRANGKGIAALDGHADANRTLIEGDLEVDLAPNDVILLRWWYRYNAADWNPGLAMDDLKVEITE